MELGDDDVRICIAGGEIDEDDDGDDDPMVVAPLANAWSRTTTENRNRNNIMQFSTIVLL
jgi:hypothetical protein